MRFIADCRERDIRSISDDIAYLDLAVEDCDKELARTATRHDEEIASLRQRSVKLISIILSEPNLDLPRRERAVQLILKVTSHLDQGDSALASQTLVELGRLTDSPLPDASPAKVLREVTVGGRAWDLSPRTRAELLATSDQLPPTEFPEELEDPPGWEWHGQKLEQMRLVAHSFASAKEGRYRDRALGPFLATRAKQLLLSGNPDLALVFFREAYSWAVQSPASLRAPLRWRKDCAWGVLLSVILAFRPANKVHDIEQEQLLSPQNLEALFHREIGPLPLAIIEEMQLFSDVAYHVLVMETQTAEHFIRDHLWEYLSERSIALQEFAGGLTSGLPEQAARVLGALCVLLELSGDTSNKAAAVALRPLAESISSTGTDERELRYLLDDVRLALRPAAEQSDLAESMIEGIETRSGISLHPSEPRVTVRMIINHEGAASRKRLALRLSYVTGEEVLRGVQISARLETQQGRLIEDAIDAQVPLGHLTPGETREIGIPFHPKTQVELASAVVVNVGRRDANGILNNVEVNGALLALS